MFDGKYNQLYDNTLFRVGVNAAFFVMWLSIAFALLAAR